MDPNLSRFSSTLCGKATCNTKLQGNFWSWTILIFFFSFFLGFSKNMLFWYFDHSLTLEWTGFLILSCAMHRVTSAETKACLLLFKEIIVVILGMWDLMAHSLSSYILLFSFLFFFFEQTSFWPYLSKR